MRLIKSLVLLFVMPLMAVAGSVSVTRVTAQQQFSRNGLVDISVTLQGELKDIVQIDCTFVATNGATKTAIPVTHITRNGDDTGSGTSWTRKFIWNAKAGVGAVKIDDVALTVNLKPHGGVQLWENGPYWAECNVGATKPEEFGYYFWWGDTAGYKRNASNDGWVSVRGNTGFSFSSGNCPTYGKNNFLLQSDGYIDATGNLVAAHDAATTHLGLPWRMPTDAEFSALIDNCTTTWTTRNGVFGRLVTGKGAYSSKSIFLPATGNGRGSGLKYLGSCGYFWSSTPDSDDSDDAWYLYCGSDNFCRGGLCRYYGKSVRPVREISHMSEVSFAGVTTHLALDCREEERIDSPIHFADCPYWGFRFEGQMKGVPYKQEDCEFKRGRVVAVITKRGRLDSYQPTNGSFFALPVTGVSAKNEIQPVFSWATANENMVADCQVLTDEELRQIVSGGVSESNGWEKDQDDPDEVWLLQDFVTMTSHGREWPRGLWPNGVSDEGRYWIYVRVNNLGYLDSELWTGDYTFRVGLGGTSEWTEPLHITFDASTDLSPSDMWRNVAFSGITSWSLKDHNQCRIGGLSFYGLGLFSGSFPLAAKVSVPSAGILYLYSGEGDDISDETLAVTSNTNISSDKTILFVEDGDGEMNSWYPIENFCTYSGCGSLRAIEVDGAATLSLKMKDTYQPKLDLMRVQFYQLGRKSAAVEASCGTPIPSPYREWDYDMYLQGKVTGMGVYSSGETVRLVAAPGPGEAFDHWEVLLGNVPTGTNLLSPTLEFVMTDEVAGTPEDRKQIVVRAVWREKFAVTALPIEAGTAVIDGSGLYFNGEAVEFKVKPAEGYEFVKWLDGSTENPRTVSALSGGGDRVYYAVVEKSDDESNPMPDGGPYTETVNGVTWTYGVEYGEACVGYGWAHRAVEDTISGEVTIPSLLGGRTVTRISVGAFFKCSKLTSVILPSGVRTLGEGCFEHCGELVSIEFPKGLIEIGDYAFHDCGKLQSVAIPDSAIRIGSCAFKGCRTIESLTVPGYVANIGSLAFEDCGGLTSIVLGENVSSIGENAFLKCDALKTVMFEGAPPTGLDSASIKQDVAIRYCMFYEEEWRPVVDSGRWSDIKGYWPSEYVAELNGLTYYNSLEAAFVNLAQGSNTVRLLRGVTASSVRVYEEYQVTLDLNGFSITQCNDMGNMLFDVKGEMTVVDSSGGGAIVGTEYSDTSGGAFSVTGALTLKGCSISNFNAKVGGCAYVWQGGKLVIEDGVEISKCSSSEGGGGLYVRGELDFNGGLVSDCSSAKEGGGIKVEKTGVLNMAGGLVTGCTGVGAGGVFNRGVFLMTGGELSDNTATRSDYPDAVIVGNDLFMEYGDVSVTINGGSVKSSIGYHSSYLDGYKAKTFLQGGLYGDRPLDDFVTTGYAVKAVVDPDLLEAGWGYSVGVDEKTLSDLLVGCRDVASSGAAEWFTKQMDGEWVLQSGAISDNQSSILTCLVQGAGILAFKWKSSSEVFKNTPIDYGEFKVDGVARTGRIGGDNDWMLQSITIDGESSHTLMWTYTKDVGDFQGKDCIWLKDVVWTPDAVAPTFVELAKVFGEDSDVVKNITDETELVTFNDFLKKCSINSASDLKSVQKQYAYQSFKLSEITIAPQLFEEEPILKIDDLELTGGNLSVTISLTVGAEAIQLAKDKLAEKIRVGSTLGNITDKPTIVPTPAADGTSLTFTITPPVGNQGFVTIQID